jgi:hypothetical protein
LFVSDRSFCSSEHKPRKTTVRKMVIGRGLIAEWLNVEKTFIKGKMAAGKADILSDENPAAKLAMPLSMAKAIGR